jgi:hypothetical protein
MTKIEGASDDGCHEGVLLDRMRIVFAMIMAVGFLLLSGTSSAEVVCEELRLKPLRCVCGTVINQVGEIVANASVAILKDGKEIASTRTGADGKFSFNDVQTGSYDLDARAHDYNVFRFPIVVQKSGKKCKQALEIVLNVGGLENCTNISLIKR